MVRFTDVSEVLAAYIIRAMALIMEASTFETSLNFCQTTQRCNPEDSRHDDYEW
jgi:hypothetical protein